MKIPIVLKARVEKIEPYVYPVHEESYWVGSAFLGKYKNPSNKPRRFLRARDSSGVSTYFYWTEPNKGVQAFSVIQFRKRVKITIDDAIYHFSRKNKQSKK